MTREDPSGSIPRPWADHGPTTGRPRADHGPTTGRSYGGLLQTTGLWTDHAGPVADRVGPWPGSSHDWLASDPDGWQTLQSPLSVSLKEFPVVLGTDDATGK